ncbi:hypothetical protein [Terrihalobacillus insolitus]|uniref:hypothetical protein n=1 Tax=Terrihalobacillus insolitus TaxID=2950438 RepID=UPI00234045CC|nr:hypothetical protein [Terrihalobacillus insolitus]MDC3414254.1 hypothetical protein [Terrihalobacillus insolitus]
MKKLNVTKIDGKYYQLPKGYYAVEGRFGDQVYKENGAKNVTSKIMGDHNKGSRSSDDYIILTDNGVEKLILKG